MFLKNFNPMIIFVAFGIFLIVAGLVMRIREHIFCTQEVEAECVDVVICRRRKKHRPMKSPVWQYCWNGRTYYKQDQNGNNIINYRIGEKCTLCIDPNKPERFCRKGMTNAVVTIIAGCIWTGFVLFAMNFDRILNFVMEFV